jgi:hypothetical protein
MRKLWPSIRLVVSALIFVFAAGVALTLARGNTITQDGIVQTGTIRLKVNPNSSGLRVFLDSQLQRLDNDTLTSVIPGTYELSVQLEGYKSWSQRVEIRKGIVADFSVQLFPEDSQLESLTNTNVSSVVYNYRNKSAYYTVIDSQISTDIGLWQRQIEEPTITLIPSQPQRISNITPTINAAIEANQFAVLPSPDDSKLLVKIGDSYHLLATNRYNEPDLTNQLTLNFEVERVSWLNNSNLLIQSDTALIDYNTDSQINSLVYLGAAQIEYVNANGTVYVELDGDIYVYRSQKLTPLVIENLDIPSADRLFVNEISADVIVIRSGTNLYYLDTKTKFLVELGQYTFVNISPDSRKLILEASGEYTVVEIEYNSISNTVAHTYSEIAISEGTIISEIFWSSLSDYFIFVDPASDNAIYVSDRSGKNIQILIPDARPASYVFNSTRSYILFHLFDSNPETGSETRANIYKYKL